MYKLDREQKALAINLAILIDCGEADIKEVLKLLSSHKQLIDTLLDFWSTCNDMTRDVANKFILCKTVEDLERCYSQRAKNYPIIEQ